MVEPAFKPIDPAVLSRLRCPLTRSVLQQEGDVLVAQLPEGAGLRYPIRDGIPVLLMDQASLPADVDSLEAFKVKYGGSFA